MRRVKINIKAYPRSGTRYITKVLNEVGVVVGHEELKKDGIVSWWHDNIQADFLLHQTRNPLFAISSLSLGVTSNSKKTIKSWLGGTSWNSNLEMAMKLYEYQHINIAKLKPVIRYQVENIPWDEIKEIISIPKDKAFPNSISKKDHSRNYDYKVYSWEELSKVNEPLSERLYNIYREYGYGN